MFMKVKDASWESVNKFFVAFFLEIWWSIDLICGTCLKYVGIATFLIPFYIPVYRYQVMEFIWTYHVHDIVQLFIYNLLNERTGFYYLIHIVHVYTFIMKDSFTILLQSLLTAFSLSINYEHCHQAEYYVNKCLSYFQTKWCFSIPWWWTTRDIWEYYLGDLPVWWRIFFQYKWFSQRFHHQPVCKKFQVIFI